MSDNRSPHSLPVIDDSDTIPSPVIQPSVRYRTEPELRTAIVRLYRSYGIHLKTSVVCTAGSADLVTPIRDVIYEVKLRLTRTALFQAVGQVLLYRQAINPNARAVILGYETSETAAFIPHAKELGVEIVCWNDEEMRLNAQAVEANNLNVANTDIRLGYPESLDHSSNIHSMQRGGTSGSSLPSAFMSVPFQLLLSETDTPALRWNIQLLARAHGIESVAALARQAGLPRQSLYELWRDEAENVSLAMIGKLAQTLDTQPGEWFRWEGKRLVWNIAAVATARGLDQGQLGFEARLYPRSIQLYWQGQAKYIFIATLGKLARVLQLDVGELFRWESVR